MLVKDYMPFFSGAKFDDGKKFDFSDKNVADTRIGFITERIKGKNIIHLGAADHIGLIDKKIKDNTWLHKLISESSKHCLGVDINSEAVNHCNELGWDNMICADMIKDSATVIYSLGRVKQDYIVAGEIVEHVDNPVQFLRDINRIYFAYVERIIITVPNAFRAANIKFCLKGVEGINTDHKYWFTPYTICKVVFNAGMIPEEICYAGKVYGKTGALLKIFAQNICAEDIICVAKLNRTDGINI